MYKYVHRRCYATLMRVLVFQHIPVEHPGVFREFLAVDGHGWLAVELDTGEAIPDLGDFDMLWVMGGPMDTWQEDDYPWLIDEKRAIREAVYERKMPFLGICLGAQLLADALGGTTGPMRTSEVGVMEVGLTEEGLVDPLFDGFASNLRCLHEVNGTPTRYARHHRAHGSCVSLRFVMFKPLRWAIRRTASSSTSSRPCRPSPNGPRFPLIAMLSNRPWDRVSWKPLSRKSRKIFLSSTPMQSGCIAISLICVRRPRNRRRDPDVECWRNSSPDVAEFGGHPRRRPDQIDHHKRRRIDGHARS